MSDNEIIRKYEDEFRLCIRKRPAAVMEHACETMFRLGWVQGVMTTLLLEKSHAYSPELRNDIHRSLMDIAKGP
jgi:hypothetical protein